MRGKGPGLEYTPRRTTRSATVNAPRKSKATTAETVLLKALGITPEGLAVTDETHAQLRQMFDSPIQEPQLRAIASIFGKAIPFDLGQEVPRRWHCLPSWRALVHVWTSCRRSNWSWCAGMCVA